MIALIDNYDSFTFNLYHQLCQFSSNVYVFPNDKITANELRERGVKALVLSPGPGNPYQSGESLNILNEFYFKIPILGICLGMQLIACKFGAKYRKMTPCMHGIQSKLFFEATGILKSIDKELLVGRYHSLEILDEESFSKYFYINARDEKGTIMSIGHKELPIYGLQFHPESILTPLGSEIIKQFIEAI